MASISEQITELAAPLAASLGLALWGVEYLPGGRSVLRVFVEDASHTDDQAAALAGSAPAAAGGFGKDGPEAAPDDAEGLLPQGVTIDQCAHLSRLLGLALDVEDILPGAYVLEVSSPGLDRTFFTASQLAGALGATVELVFTEPPEEYPGRRKFRGALEKGNPETGFALRLEDVALPGETPDLLHFAFGDLKKAKQVFVVPEKERPGKGGGKKGKTPRPQDSD